jgi:hypothetical protein
MQINLYFTQKYRIYKKINKENNKALQSYDLIAIRTKNEKVMHALAFEVDVNNYIFWRDE